MREILLTQGYTTQVDDKEYESLNQYKWYAHVARHKDGSTKVVYAVRSVYKDGTQATQQMHNLIMGAKGIDHEDGNGLNNQRQNLRLATKQQNGNNRRLSIDNTSGYKGVCWHKAKNKWGAQITVNGEIIHLGYYVDIPEAAQAYDRAAKELHGKFALTNAMLRAAA